MLKWNYAIHLALAGLLGVPVLIAQEHATERAPVASSSDRRAGLERSLEDTLRALEVLAGFEKRATEGDPPADELIRDATEPPIPGARERDAQLAALRDEVSRLQMLQDEIDARRALASSPAAPSAQTSATGAAGDAPSARRPGVVPTTGLGEEERLALAAPLPPPTSDATPQSDTARVSALSAADAGDVPIAVADPLRQAQACYRAGRYAECLTLMRSLGKDVRAQYWAGRALEKLDRIDDAIAAYRAVAETQGAGYLATRAANDLEYLRWRVGFADRRAQREPQRSTSSVGSDEGDAP